MPTPPSPEAGQISWARTLVPFSSAPLLTPLTPKTRRFMLFLLITSSVRKLIGSKKASPKALTRPLLNVLRRPFFVVNVWQNLSTTASDPGHTLFAAILCLAVLHRLLLFVPPFQISHTSLVEEMVRSTNYNCSIRNSLLLLYNSPNLKPGYRAIYLVVSIPSLICSELSAAHHDFGKRVLAMHTCSCDDMLYFLDMRRSVSSQPSQLLLVCSKIVAFLSTSYLLASPPNLYIAAIHSRRIRRNIRRCVKMSVTVLRTEPKS